ncbi:hypothetical protein [Brevundimonas nasdae]|uniref:Ig-like domain-containing protein n=1 Tax=Brevundimonas nasdae TaxID=172043 RepID=A0ABX8TIL2_9CAUL|nr:hypothetical protein [Brevundimonas nasdae]QYC11026.1 hypothetical protein KWG56_03170 [Brevundimonas nasdae]
MSSGYVRLTSENFVTPTGTVRGVVNIDYSGASFSPGGYAGWRRLKLEPGPVCTTWSDDASTRALSASVTEQSLAIIDLENQQAIAAWRVKAEAAGGRPAIIEAVSSTLGGYIAFGAEQIYFGDNTVFDDATDTLQTVVGDHVRVLGLGAAFGAANNLLEWWGPASIALGAMTTSNGLQGRMSNAPYVFDNTIAKVFGATPDQNGVAGGRTGPGNVQTNIITISVVNASGPVTYNWYFLSGDLMTVTAPTSAATRFSGSVTAGQTKRAAFACRVTDLGSGQSQTVVVNAILLDNSPT